MSASPPSSSPPPAGTGAGGPGRKRSLETAALLLLLALAGWFYFWTATTAGSPFTWERPAYDLYNRLADGFLAGRTSFLEEPPPELARLADPYDPAQNAPYKKYHDVSYYRGRYYLYFGPAPAVVLLAPWKLLTGSSLPQNLAVVVFAWGSALLGVLLLRGLRDRYFPALSGWLFWPAVGAAVFGNLLPVLLRRPLYYELAVAGAVFFGLGGLYALWRATAGGRRLAWLGAAGLAFGLAVASRPNYAFAATAALLWQFWSWWRDTGGDPAARIRAVLRPVLAAGLPFAAVALALMAYNYARFGSLGEFGTSYMLAGGNQAGVAQLGLRYLPINLYYHLAALPHVTGYFPFVQVTGFPPFAPAAGYGGQENMYGILPTLPLVLALWPLWRALRRGTAATPWQDWARSAGLLALVNLLLLLLLMGAANRYQLDYVPYLIVLAALGCWHAGARLTGWRAGLLRGGWVAAGGLAVGFTTLVSLQHNELFKYHNPAAYGRLARWANGLAEPFTRAADRSGPLRIELTFPRNRVGQAQPLLVTGASFRADFIYVVYQDERHIVLGFEHTSYGGPISAPLRIDFDVPHVLEIQAGSLYPPREHPWYDAMPPERIERLRRTLEVKLDGKVVLSGRHDFYDSAPGDVTVGRNPISDAFGRRFTGQVRSVTRLPVPE